MTADPVEATGSEPGRLVTYEQPLTERVRTFLRLQFLARQAAHFREQDTPWGTRAAVGALLEILTTLRRGDVRGEVLKELERQSSGMAALASHAGVDRERLDACLTQFAQLREALGSTGANFLQPLLQSEFLNAIKHRSAIPGGTCEFDLPEFSHWLRLPFEDRMRDFDAWFAPLQPLCDGVDQLLWMTRESANQSECVARGGMYQHGLARGQSCELLRVSLPGVAGLYPEISGSQHRFTIRFLTWNGLEGRPVQATDDVPFLLACC